MKTRDQLSGLMGRSDPASTKHRDLLQKSVIGYAIVASFILAASSRSFLPEKMLYDDSTLQDFIHGYETNLDTKYGRTAWLYRIIGLGDSELLVSIVAMALLTISVLVALRSVGRYGQTWTAVAIASGSLLLGGVYLGIYTKEFFVIPIVALLVILPRRWWAEASWIGLCLLYADAVREYWFVVAGLYIGFRFGIRYIERFASLIWGWLALLATVVVVFNLFLGENATYNRVATNDKLVIDRATVISDPISGDAIPIQFLNLILVVVLLLLPFALLFAGSFLHIASALAIGTLWILVIRSTYRYFKYRATRDVVLERAIALLFAFVTVQCLFEPDYGSYLRHLIPLLPLTLVIVGRAAVYRGSR